MKRNANENHKEITTLYTLIDLATTSRPTLVTPWTVACQVPLSMGFSRQGYWSGLLSPSPGNLPGSPALQVDSLPAEL